MLSSSQVAQVYGVFQKLLNDLEPFVNVSEMRLAFDKGGNATRSPRSRSWVLGIIDLLHFPSGL